MRSEGSTFPFVCFFFISFFQGGLSSASDAYSNVITLFFCQRNSKVKESMEPRTRDGWHNGDTFRLLWMVLGEDWGILFLFSFPLPSSNIIKGDNCSWLECIVLALAQKGFASMGGGFTLHGRFASMVYYFAWCASITCASFSSSSPSPPPPKKEENKTKEEKLSLLWAWGV